MLRKLFKTISPKSEALPIRAFPAGSRGYAIGDIHGRLDLLEQLVERIAADDAARGPADTTLIFLGDLVDRGPESAQVVEYLRQLEQRRAPGSTRFLLGNHEEVFLAALEDEKALRFFTRIGGKETILSYGITPERYNELDYPELLEALQAQVPAEHVAFVSRFEDLILMGDYAFVHAGIRPSEPLERQRVKDLRWIREEFLAHSGPLEKLIVHGHTIAEDVEVTPHRIGLDTGAYASGKLTAMGFEGDQRWVIDTAA
jgi:serine/threonine protein phosphatase 1